MAQDDSNKEDKFDFTSEGEVLGYISLDQAVLRARLLVRQDEARYLERLGWDEVVWAESNSDQREDTYRVVLQFRRPARGLREEQTGEEEFLFDLAGSLQDRQVLVWPETGSMHGLVASENSPARPQVPAVRPPPESSPSPVSRSPRPPNRPVTSWYVSQIDDWLLRGIQKINERLAPGSGSLSNLLRRINAWIRKKIKNITLLVRRSMPLYFPPESEDQSSAVYTVLRCPQCHAEYKPGQRLCTSCGVVVDERPSSGVSPTIEPLVTFNCSRCLADYSPGQKFCIKCGAAIDAAPTLLPPPSTQPGLIIRCSTGMGGDTPARNPHPLEAIISAWGSLSSVFVLPIIRVPVGVILALWGGFLLAGAVVNSSTQGALAGNLVILAGGGATILAAGLLLGGDRLQLRRGGKGKIAFLLTFCGYPLFIVLLLIFTLLFGFAAIASDGILVGGLALLTGSVATICPAGLLLGWERLRLRRVGNGKIAFMLSIGGFSLFVVGLMLAAY